MFRERRGKNEKPPKAAMGSELCIAPSGRHCSTDTTARLQGKVFRTEVELSKNPKGVNMTTAPSVSCTK